MLDRVSRGRAGWNIVTSGNEMAAHNFGHDAHLEHGRRYARATEFLDVTMKLWSSWEEAALIADRAGGRFVNRGRIHRIAFGRGYDTFAGTPAQIVDHMEEWFTSGACDGFNLLPPTLPGDFHAFVSWCCRSCDGGDCSVRSIVDGRCGSILGCAVRDVRRGRPGLE